MTINALNKLTQKLVKEGWGHREVCIDKSTFTHPLESDGACILTVVGGEVKCFEMMYDYGGMKELALVLVGE